ncbi:MAG: ACT domain-containing protein [Oscillospiraceae bacterium]|nr:ACT domain-containing protein [Oscillospiraceae bacterium]
MKIKAIEYDFTVCKVTGYSLVNLDSEYVFLGKTDEERSLVCLTSEVPSNTTERTDGWRAFRIEGVLDFSLIGVLSKICGILAENKIGVFAVSTYNTDYVLTKKEQFENALQALENAGYEVEYNQ